MKKFNIETVSGWSIIKVIDAGIRADKRREVPPEDMNTLRQSALLDLAQQGVIGLSITEEEDERAPAPEAPARPDEGPAH